MRVTYGRLPVSVELYGAHTAAAWYVTGALASQDQWRFWHAAASTMAKELNQDARGLFAVRAAYDTHGQGWGQSTWYSYL